MDVRLLRLLAIGAMIVGFLYAPFHAAAYLATEEGETALIPWDAPFRRIAGGAFTFDEPDAVYLFFGKLAWIPIAGMLLAALVVRRRMGDAGRAGKVGGWLLVGGLSLLALGAFVEYYTPWLEQGFLFLAAPGALLALAGHVTFGIAIRRHGAAPAWATWIFLLAPIVLVAMIAIFGHIPLAFIPIEAAWIAALLRGPADPS